MRRRTRNWPFWIYLVLFACVATLLRRSFPALTETQLIFRLWPFWLGAVVIGLIIAVVFSRRKPP